VGLGRPEFLQRELYDHQVDPAENINLADHPSHAGTIGELLRLLPNE
jgi:hypothetical protein